jgi:hypothetical protein
MSKKFFAHTAGALPCKTTFVSLFLLAVLALSVTACNQVQISFGGANAVVGSGKVVTETREVSGFTRVLVTGSGQAEITIGDSDSLVIEAEDNILPLIESSVLNGTLTIGLQPNTSISTMRGIRYTITVQSLTDVETSGSTDITVTNTARTDAFSASTSGSGAIKLTDVQAKILTVQTSGSGNINAAGKVDKASIATSGSGNFNGGDLQCASATATTSGSGNVTLWVTGSLTARTSGSGNVRYYGQPSVSRSESGSGRVSGLGSK